MAKETKDIQRVGDLYRGLTGTNKGDRPEDVAGQAKAAVTALDDRDTIEEDRIKGLEAQQKSADKSQQDRFKRADERNAAAARRTPAKKTAARKTTARKRPAKKTAAKKS